MIKLMSFNVRQWSRDKDSSTEVYWKTRMKKISDLIRSEKPDILCMQELTWPATTYIPDEYKRLTHGFSHSLWVRKDSPLKKVNSGWKIFTDWCDFEYTGKKFRAMNVHGRWNDWAKEMMVNMFDKVGHKCPVIAAGDFNNTYQQMTSAGFDWLLFEPQEQDTFLNFTNPDSHGEIDLVYHSPEITVKSVRTIYDDPDARLSDHWPVICEFEI